MLHTMALIDAAYTHVELDEIVETYLGAIGERRHSGETYEETGDRLDDAVMKAAGKRWWEIEENN